MADEFEQLTEAIYRENLVRVDGVLLDRQELIRTRPGRATKFRAAAHNRIRAEAAMKRLNEQPSPKT